MNPTLGTYWKIPGTIFYYAFFVVVLILFIRRVFKLYGFLRLGTMDNKVPETAERALRTLVMRGDPWTGAQYLRTDWTEGLSVKTLSKGKSNTGHLLIDDLMEGRSDEYDRLCEAGS